MQKFFDNAQLKFNVWNRERKEKAEAKNATKSTIHSEHGHGRFFLLTIPATATILAAITEWYWAVLFCIEATGSIDWNYETSTGTDVAAASIWNFAFATHWPVFLGLVCATVPIVMLSMVWLPVQFAMRGTGRWRRGTVILVGLLANVLVIVSGTVVMNYNRQEQVREALVVEQSADAGRAAIGARLQVAQTELARITAEGNTSNEARAARAGVAGWTTYVREAQSDPSVPAADRQRIVRAMGSAEAADALRARIEALTVQQATAAPTATTAANVEDTVGRELNQFAQVVEVWRPPFVAVICTLIGIFGAWWTIALMQGLNPRDVLRSGWADEGHRIEDMREQEAVTPQEMKGPREAVFDAESGEELVPVRATWRKKPKRKGQTGQMELTPGSALVEKNGKEDGGNRTASVTIGGVMEVPESAAQAIREGEYDQDVDAPQTNQDEGEAPEIGVTNETLPETQNEPSEELPDLSDMSLEEAADEQTDQPDREPETDPSRLIAAE